MKIKLLIISILALACLVSSSYADCQESSHKKHKHKHHKHHHKHKRSSSKREYHHHYYNEPAVCTPVVRQRVYTEPAYVEYREVRRPYDRVYRSYEPVCRSYETVYSVCEPVCRPSVSFSFDL